MNWIGLYTFIRREVSRILRVATQTIISPLISATLYIFIFGYVIGTRIDLIAGVEYITFVFPGILMLNIITSAFSHSSSSVYMGRFMKSIEDVLVSPFSHFEIVIGYTAGAVIRALLVSVGVLLVGVLFGAVTLEHPLQFFFYVTAVSTVFALLGILVGLWANSFEQLAVLNTFIITPLSYLGGIFYSISMLPQNVQFLTHINPFFYFVDGIRGSMIGITEAQSGVGLMIIGGLIIGLGLLVVHLFNIGWRIRS